MQRTPQGRWQPLNPATQPPSWRGSSLVFDQKRQQAVLFAVGETWLWDGASWSQARGSRAPAPRNTTHLVYDALTETVLLFGGIGLDGSPLNDVWLWDGANWSEQQPVQQPLPLGGAALACDLKSRQVILFGGITTTGDAPGANRTGTFSNTTWLWDGAQWTALPASQTPPARVNGQMVYDEARQQTLLFGGYGPAGYLNDMWLWRGTGWEKLSPPALPSPGIRSHATFHGQLRQILLFTERMDETASFQHTLQTWTWNGSSWSQAAPDQPLPGSIEGCAYDSQRALLLACLVTGDKALLPNKENSAVLPELAAPTLASQTWSFIPQ